MSDTDDYLLQLAFKELDTLWFNQWVVTADINGIEAFERMFSIAPDPTVDIEIRRRNLLNRYSMQEVYTLPFLRQRLDVLIGVGQYTLTIDYANQLATIELPSGALEYELIVTITKIKPCALAFKSKTNVSSGVKVNEEISTGTRTWNYILGVWALSNTLPFQSSSNLEVIKMEVVPSVKPPLLNSCAKHISEVAIEVLAVGDLGSTTIPITGSFSGNVAILDYVIPASANIGTVERLDVRNLAGNVLTSAIVAVPTTYDVGIQHKIPFREDV
jgi:hypothetical protein